MITKERIKDAVENTRLIQRKSTSKDGVYVLKYKNKVFYRNLWDPVNVECRGTVVDENYNVIARPFTKIFNLHENNAGIHGDSNCIAVDKINGFMASATWYNDELLVSTTGTIDSDYAKLAHDWLKDYQKPIKNMEGYTFIFEIVDPTDPHIIEEAPGVYLLGIRRNDWKAEQNAFNQSTIDTIAMNVKWMRPVWFEDTFDNIKKRLKDYKREGFVVYEKDTNYSLKMKSSYYLSTKFLTRLREDHLLGTLDNPDKLKQRVDEEFYEIIDYLSYVKDQFTQLEEHDRIKFIRGWFKNE